MFQLRKENTEKLIFLFTEVVEEINARMKPFLQEKIVSLLFLLIENFEVLHDIIRRQAQKKTKWSIK